MLVGTTSVEKSEYLSKLLVQLQVPHEVLNAKQHEREATIVAQAGHAGAVTVATNMAGRGTDIVLGGNPEFLADLELRSRGLDPVEPREEYEAAWDDVVAEMKAQVAAEAEEVRAAGGLYVLGTERHESRRIDNQLRGRSGRQGDPGESRFYLSLGDELMRRFNGQLVESIMNRFNLPDDVPIEAGMVTKAIRSAQTQVEQQNFEIRKNVLKYDEVLNKQRTVIYDERRRVLAGEDIERADRAHARRRGQRLRRRRHRRGLRRGLGPRQAVDGAGHALPGRHPLAGPAPRATIDDLTRDALAEAVLADARAAYARREAEIDAVIGAQGGMRELERQVLLQVMDRKWREHLYEMDYLKEGIGLRAMAQRDPLIEYQREGFDMFAAMLEGIKEETVGHLFNVRVQAAAPPAGARPVADGAAASRRRSRRRPGAGRPQPHRRRLPRQIRRGRAHHPGPRRGPANVARGRHAAPEIDPDATGARCPRVLSGGGPRNRAAELQYSGPAEDGSAHRPAAGPAGGGRRGDGGPRRRAVAQPAVPVRLGPQVQALPRDADGRAPLSATAQSSAAHRHSAADRRRPRLVAELGAPPAGPLEAGGQRRGPGDPRR